MLDLANFSGPALYHCDFGKDRTGWTSVILQSIAGVSLPTIKQDYLASNKYLGDPFAVQEKLVECCVRPGGHFLWNDGCLLDARARAHSGRHLRAAREDGLFPTLPGQGGFSGNASAAGVSRHVSTPHSPATIPLTTIISSRPSTRARSGASRPRSAARFMPMPPRICCASLCGSIGRSHPMRPAAISA